MCIVHVFIIVDVNNNMGGHGALIFTVCDVYVHSTHARVQGMSVMIALHIRSICPLANSSQAKDE